MKNFFQKFLAAFLVFGFFSQTTFAAISFSSAQRIQKITGTDQTAEMAMQKIIGTAALGGALVVSYGVI